MPDAWSYAASSNYGVALRLQNGLKYVYNNSPWEPVRGSEQLYRLEGPSSSSAWRASVR